MNDELPEGWADCAVAAVAEDISYGFTAKSSASAAGPKYLRITDIQRGSVDWTSVPHCEVPRDKKSAYALLPGDVVFARTGATTGKSYLIMSCPDAVFASYLIRVRPSPAVLPDFLYHFFQSHSYWTQISENISGSAQPNCNATKLSALTISLPPMEEQRRIVEELTKLLTKAITSQERLHKVPAIIKRFRQAVLAAGCTGRLTADWRSQQTGAESGMDAVKEIEAAREHAVGQHTSKRVAEPTNRDYDRVEVLSEHEWPEEDIPETWVWVRFGSIIGELRNGVSPRPNIQPPGIPILRISAARPGSVDLSDVRYMPNGKEFVPTFALRDNDLLFTRYNGSIELLGVCGMVRGLGKNTLLYPDKLMRVRFDHEWVLPRYTEIFFQSGAVHDRVVAKSKSSAGQNGVSGSDIRGQSFALPSLAEQREIVRRVDKLMALADNIDARYHKANAQIEKVTQSVTAKAFCGELVPTEAELARREGRSYETAEELLQRIRKERENTNGSKRHGRGKVRR